MATTSRGRAASSKSAAKKTADDHDGAASAKVAEAADHASSLLEDATSLASHAVKFRDTWERRARDLGADHPYLALLGATGTGFVLGGGLTIGLSRRLWTIGARLALSIALQKLTQANFIGQVLGSSDDKQ